MTLASNITGPQHEVPTSVDPVLVNILSWPRSHNTQSELDFNKWLLGYLTNLGAEVHQRGHFNVIIAKVPGAKADSTTMFSCHVDTIDPISSKDERKKLTYDPNFGLIALEKDSYGSSLGADDGVGVWLMIRMIEAKVPGTYVFHRGEECGGLSAKNLMSSEKEYFKQFEAAIAFDRPRDNEIITHQGGVECASNKFAVALCDRLNALGFDYRPSNRGVYTDTKEYRTVIAECINIGVGYEGQHGKSETLDYAHAYALLQAILKIDFDSLPIDRDPTKVEAATYWTPESGKSWTEWCAARYGHKPTWADRNPGPTSNVSPLKGKKKKAKKPAKWTAQSSLLDDDVPFNDPFNRKPTSFADDDGPDMSLKDFTADALANVKEMNYEDIAMMTEESPEEAALTIAALLLENERLRAEVRTLNTLLGF